MSEHVCGPPYPPKWPACCLCCRTPAYEVLVTRDQPGHPLDGAPKRRGAMLDAGTQVEFLMSDGAEADITFCTTCAANIEPAHYQPIWRACIAAAEVQLRLAGKSDNERVAALAALMAIWPMALVRRRHEAEGTLTVDRR